MKEIMLCVLKPQFRNSLIIKRVFHELPRAGYPPVYDKKEKLNFFQRVQRACSEFKDEWKLFIEEIRNDFSPNTIQIIPGDPHIVWKFDGTQKSLDQWIVNSDKDYAHGFSTAHLELSPSGTGIFHGVLDTRVPKDGRTKQSGYCNITSLQKRQSFKRKTYYNWENYNELILRIRGDGRCYMLNILQKGFWDITWYDAFHYVMYTRGGPYWQIVKVPFSKFVFSAKGQIQENQHRFPASIITNFGITLVDKKPGPFRLEIDYIALAYNPYILETFAYESYDIPYKKRPN